MEKRIADAVQAAALPFVSVETLTDDEQVVLASLNDAIAIIENMWDMFSRTPRYKTCSAIGDIKWLLLSCLSCFHTVDAQERQALYRITSMKFISEKYVKNIALCFRKAPAVWGDAERIDAKERFTRLMSVVAPRASTLRK